MILLAASNNSKYFDKNHSSYNYINNLKLLVNSLNIHCPHIKKKALLINFQRELQLNNTEIEYRIIRGTPEEIRNYSAHIRTELFMENMNDNKYLIWLDVDTLVRGNIQEFIDILLLDSPTVAVQCRYDRRDEEKFQVAVVGININETTKETISKWNIYAKENHWFADQLGLYKAAVETNINIKDIGSMYNDSEFNSSSLIWHCKGNYNNPIWKTEIAKYL